MKPGIYSISNKAYHSGPGISSTGLKKLLNTGAHFKHAIENPKEPDKAMVLGSMVHTMILEPHLFEKEYYVGDFNIRRGKDYEAAIKEAGERTVINKEEYEKALAIADAFNIQALSHPDLNGQRNRLLDGEKEKSYYWEDPTTGVLCKCRTDVKRPGEITDLKTTRNASFDSFQKDVATLLYHLSAAFYKTGVKAVTGENIKRVSLIVIETEAPFLIRIFHFHPNALSVGDRQVKQALDLYAECVISGEWKGYPAESVEIDLPNWFYYKMNKE